jgi:hypothetical protein
MKTFFEFRWSTIGFLISILFLLIFLGDYSDPEGLQMIFGSLPWSILFLILSIFTGEFILNILLGAGVVINAIIIYRASQSIEESIQNRVFKYALISILTLIFGVFSFAFVNDVILK